VLPLDVLTDLVRSYTTQAQSVVPQFLAASFAMLREGQTKMVDNLTKLPPPIAGVPGLEAMQRQQRAFLKSMMSSWPGVLADDDEDEHASKHESSAKDDDLAQIKAQLAELQQQLAKLGKQP
jgi:polyhydroxyalkanoate synthesis regulator protein